MINFKPITLEDKAWVDQLLAAGNKRGCEYTFANMFIWSKAYHVKVAQVNGYLVVKLKGINGICYMYPSGSGDIKSVILEMKQDSVENQHEFLLIGIEQQGIRELEELFPGWFTYEEEPDSSDYLYDVEKLAELAGRKLHGKRNHINRFIESNLFWSFEPITVANIHECYALDEEWYKLNQDNQFRSDSEEDSAFKRALDHLFALNLEGGLLRLGGKVVALTVGGRINQDTYDIHFEEAYKDINGSYAMINREFARYIKAKYPEVVYLNREDDMGLPGLRKAKQSYYPDAMVMKHKAAYNG
ncbi:MAG: hypothetical protein H6Q67_3 [Firmicutes bacterium]|nr:hypothetical protein [Bacillota bacterium]